MSQSPSAALPPITIGRIDHERLVALAEHASPAIADAAGELLSELDRADVVADEALPRGIVRMGSRVTFVSDGRPGQTVELVYPAEADIAQMKISVLTPVGAALIGMQRGQSIAWVDRGGRRRSLRVVAVEAAEGAA